MLRKILSLSLVAVMLSVAALASPDIAATLSAAYAEADPVVTDEITKSYDYTAFEELLFVQPSETAGEYGVTKLNMGAASSRGDASVKNKWWLVKVYVGKNWNFDSENAAISMTVSCRTSDGAFTSYGIPVTKTAYEEAKAAAESKTTISTLIEPANSAASGITPKAITWSKTSTSDGTHSRDVEFDAATFTSDHYQDGYLYVAFQIINNTYTDSKQPRYYLTEARYGHWTFSVTGTRTLEAAAATVTGAFVDGATDGQQTIDCDITISEGKTVSATNWLVYKFSLPEWEDVTKVEVDITCTKTNSSWANICVYPLTEAEYAATVAGSDRTLSTANKQTLLENVLGSSRSVKFPNPRIATISTATSVTLDITDMATNDAKNGAVYVAFFAINNLTAKPSTNNRTATLSSPTLTVTGIPGESTATTVNDFSDTVLMWDGTDNSYDVCTQTATGTAKLIAVTYSNGGTTMVDAELVTIDAATKVNGAISGTISDLTAGETLKIYLWEGDTLVPITEDVIEF